MLNTLLKAWLWAGVSHSTHDNISPLRITNMMALIVIAVSVCQLPVALWFWQDGGSKEVSIVVCTVCLLCLVPMLNARQAYLQAKLFLIGVYIGDILLSSMLWQINLNIHYFYLLAILFCPFFFYDNERFWMWLSILLLGALFVLSELYYLLNSAQAFTLHQQVFKISCASLFALASVLCSVHLQKNVTRSWRKLAEEKRRSEQLLLNILPSTIAQRLKDSNTLIADYFAQASILFADIQDFTPLCKQMSPQKLVSLLNELFCRFDLLAAHYGLEKIKTSGDGYMAAAGLPKANASHAIQCCACALDMQQSFQHFCRTHQLAVGLRIGIGCGEVVAGVIGKNKFSYDIWGEAVNLASRMESHGECRKIQTTQSTFERSKHLFNFSKRGDIEIKGIGRVTTYWLLERKPSH
jgi:adenylate cyclase